MKTVCIQPEFDAWRTAARNLLQSGTAPEDVQWTEKNQLQAEFMMDAPEAQPPIPSTARVSARFLQLARTVSCHSDPHRWALLYRVIWRLIHEQPHLIKVTVDADVHRLLTMEKSVRRDSHKMKAFVRFRPTRDPNGNEVMVAWFEPEHHVVPQVAKFFRNRLAALRWSILTPDTCAHWNGEVLEFTAGVDANHAPASPDEAEDLWRRYYGSIFNPARVKVESMRSQMPKKYWKNLPEAGDISRLLQEAPERVAAMVARSQPLPVRIEHSASELIARLAPVDLQGLREAGRQCLACPLHARATHVVFGEGPANARLVLIGEQPGDQEDLVGRPFVGPAGELLTRALASAGIARDSVYLTNAVKHFKWEQRGKRRLHKKPAELEIKACRPWLKAELGMLAPQVLVCLGSTAARSVFGQTMPVQAERGRFLATEFCASTMITVHPSFLLRNSDDAAREQGFSELVADLALAQSRLDSQPHG